MSVALGPYNLNEIYTGDARELAKAIPDESVDLIFTDPPYPGEFLYLYGWLVGFAKRVLKPDGFLLMYVGPYHKDTVMSYFRGEPQYFWDYIDYNTHNSTIIWPRHTISRYKSIIAYRKIGSSALPRANVLGVLPGMGEDKRFHEWGQPEGTARYYIEYFSKGGEIVIDPFVGGGTTAAACVSCHRNYLAFEIDPATADRARERVRNTQPPLFTLQPEQLTFTEAQG